MAVLPPLFLCCCPAVSCLRSEAPSCASAAASNSANTAAAADNIAAVAVSLPRRRRLRFSIA